MDGSQHRLPLPDVNSQSRQSHQQRDSSPSPSSSAANFALAPNSSNHTPAHASTHTHTTDPHPSPLTKYSDLPSMSTGTGMGMGTGGGGGMSMSTDYADGLSTTRTISVSTPHTNTMTFSSGRTMSLFHPHGTSISASPTLASQTRSHSHDHSLPPPSLALQESAGHPGQRGGGANGKMGTKSFLDGRDEAVRRARKVYMKIYATGLCAVVVTIFIVFPLYWGSLWQIPAHAMRGWIVNFDGGTIGQRVLSDLSAASGRSIHWQEVPSSNFPNGPNDLINAMKDNQAWVAVSINPSSTARYLNSLQNPDPAYNGSAVVTAYGVEGRNENAFSRAAADLVSLMSVSPQTVTQPVGYTLVNLIPFAQPVASAVVFVGLIYLLILSFFIVAIAYNARQVSGINNILSLRSLVLVRLSSSAIGYFCLSFFYSLLNVAFKLNLSRKYGAAGFVIFWMLNWLGMLSVYVPPSSERDTKLILSWWNRSGLALESLITLLTPKWVPFFMIAWIIVNVSVCVFPIDVLPRFYRYGYAMPFYNISSSVRSITFGTRNTLGQNFGVLFAWVLISCITLPAIQWYVRRQEARAKVSGGAPGGASGSGKGGERGHRGEIGGKEAGSAASTPELKSRSRVPSGDQEKQVGR
ncbi:hypothetical protein CVT26_003398 [Gymnopilus dilepis]|uniref:DUF3533 domain-containing protein n=1 Tax=Gymnopilus dilepis TaxID=231916 RepID=A0A409Y5I7_9AGAR|nr:hypothetical protein CVT26_003398 [Gymnopilus dilepis]